MSVATPPRARAGRVNLHIYPSPFRNESRMLREARSMIELGLFSQVVVAGVWEPGLQNEESFGSGRRVVRIPLSPPVKQKTLFTEGFKYFRFLVGILRRWGRRDVDCVSCHSLHVLPIGVLYKVLWGKMLVYDAHELETETSGLRGTTKLFAKALEACLIRLADRVIVVSESIAAWYRQRYGLSEVYCVRNVPYHPGGIPIRSEILRRSFYIPADHLVFIYQGRLSWRTSVDKLLDAWVKLPESRHLVLMGMGELEGRVKELCERHPHIHFQPAVPVERVIEFTSGADVGVHFVENYCLNAYYSLPNKVFEYLMAGLPIIVRDLPEMASIVRHYDCGWTVGEGDSDLVETVAAIGLESVHEKREGALRARDLNGWQKEEQVYLKVFGRERDRRGGECR